MPRLDPDTWERIRIARESAGESFASLAERFHVSAAAICRRAGREGWGDGTDVSTVIRRKVNAHVNGVDDQPNGTNDPETRVAAIEQAAKRGAEIILIHRAEWQVHRARFGAAPADMTEVKLARLSAEMLRIRQAGEREAWGLGAGENRAEIVIERRGY